MSSLGPRRVQASVPARGRWNIDFVSLTNCAGQDVSSSECTLPRAAERNHALGLPDPGCAPLGFSLVADGPSSVIRRTPSELSLQPWKAATLLVQESGLQADVETGEPAAETPGADDWRSSLTGAEGAAGVGREGAGAGNAVGQHPRIGAERTHAN